MLARGWDRAIADGRGLGGFFCTATAVVPALLVWHSSVVYSGVRGGGLDWDLTQDAVCLSPKPQTCPLSSRWQSLYYILSKITFNLFVCSELLTTLSELQSCCIFYYISLLSLK